MENKKEKERHVLGLIEMVMLNVALVHVPTSNSNVEHCDIVFGLKSNLRISFNIE